MPSARRHVRRAPAAELPVVLVRFAPRGRAALTFVGRPQAVQQMSSERRRRSGWPRSPPARPRQPVGRVGRVGRRSSAAAPDRPRIPAAGCAGPAGRPSARTPSRTCSCTASSQRDVVAIDRLDREPRQRGVSPINVRPPNQPAGDAEDTDDALAISTKPAPATDTSGGRCAAFSCTMRSSSARRRAGDLPTCRRYRSSTRYLKRLEAMKRDTS